jgi:hypothetical protein
MSLYCMVLAKPRRQNRVNVPLPPLSLSLSLSLSPVSIRFACLAAEFAFAEVYFARQEAWNISACSM